MRIGSEDFPLFSRNEPLHVLLDVLSVDDRAVELKEQLEVEEADGDRQEEKVEEKGEVESKRVRRGWNEDDCVKCAQNLRHEVCGVIIKLWNKDARAVSVRVRHASVEVQVQCVNVFIGVVLGELHVVRVVPLVVCGDTVVRRTLVLIALHRSHCFHRSHVGFCCIRGIVFTPTTHPVGDSKMR